MDKILLIHSSIPFYFTFCAFLLGAVCGSFFNVCILRIPRGQSIVTPGSHCSCGAKIPAYLNIPILSWFILGGKAKCCGRKFSIRYSLIELLTGLLFAASWYCFPGEKGIVGMVLVSFAIILAFIDLDTMILPDSLNILFILFGFICVGIAPGAFVESGSIFDAIIFSIIGLGVGSMVVYWMRTIFSFLLRREALGEGDVILIGGIGVFLGWQGAVFSFFGSAFLGLFAIFLSNFFIKGIKRSERLSQASRLSLEGDYSADDVANGRFKAFPLGPWLLMAALIYFFAKTEINNMVIKFIGINS